MKTSRDEVYAAIDGERDYQDNLVKEKAYREVQPVAAELLMLESYVARARASWVDNSGDAVALQMIRKVAGIAVRCMENHGAPKR